MTRKCSRTSSLDKGAVSDRHRNADRMERGSSDRLRAYVYRLRCLGGVSLHGKAEKVTDTETLIERETLSARHLVLIRVLLLVARIVAPEAWALEVRNLANHISQDRGLRG